MARRPGPHVYCGGRIITDLNEFRRTHAQWRLWAKKLRWAPAVPNGALSTIAFVGWRRLSPLTPPWQPTGCFILPCSLPQASFSQSTQPNQTPVGWRSLGHM